jgi:gliding motility-associated-like protein
MADASVCIGGSITLSASNANNFTWGPGSSLSCTNCANPIASPTVTTTYTVIGNNACFQSQDQVVITVNPLPVITISAPQNICPGTFIQIFADALNAVSYAWAPATGLSGTNTSAVNAGPNVNTTYSVVITNANGCTNSSEVSVSIYPLIPINASPDVSYIYWGESTQLNTESGTTFQWQPTFGLNDPNSANPIAAPTETTTYYVTALDANGCVVTDSVIVVVNKDADVNLPSAFSPNGDGKNDAFRIIYKGIFRLDEFAVFNRWGQKVWYTKSVTEGWDGKINGEPADVGTYVYMVIGADLNNNSIVKQGNVTVIR